ncbi:MAG: beta-galactosidase GalA [Prevotella sp.]|nr:beta-galactosidase GalA [Prevotella sp.]
MLRNLYILVFLLAVAPVCAQRRTVSLDRGWKFAFGNAADPAKDFGCGTEYFNYLTKANSIHNTGPYSMKFDDSGWEPVDVPHDFVVRLPFSAEASHSHGYKTVGWKYPETSVGWYRRTFRLDSLDRGKHVAITFDGIFRDSRVWVNGFYCGGEPSGYLSQTYDITDYANFGGENVVCVRADATLEEGWFYEGGGIYRHVWLTTTSPLHIAQDGISISTTFRKGYSRALLNVRTDLFNASHDTVRGSVRYSVLDAEGRQIAATTDEGNPTRRLRFLPMQTRRSAFQYIIPIDNPQLWSPDTPYLYTLVAEVIVGGKTVDNKAVRFGVRDVVFDKDRGLLLNGKPLKIKGVNMHQDHAGVGAAIPDALLAYRIRRLKQLGCNAYRSSHNPMSPAMLDVCDSLGMLVIDETRLAGINANETSALRRMIERDRNHPSVILWSAGNEEWGIEWDKKGERIAATMRDYCHLYDPSRPMTFATSGGPTVEVPVDVAGYNYIMQNPIDEHRRNYPDRRCYGSEETTGCGTRGVYFPDAEGRWMPALNRVLDQRDSTFNQIERGWRFYAERPWAAGCFFWTGFDYRGEPNPMKFPATGSQFGILDYCGFAKDEAEYLRAWWTDDTVLHILPHWNLAGHEGEEVSVWAYSNCDEVELFCNGKSLGRQTMPRYGHLEWTAVYRPGRLKAVGYKAGRRVCQTVVATAGAPAQIRAAADRTLLAADGADVAVVDITLHDRRGTLVPDANVPLTLSVEGNASILGVGNGNPAMQAAEQPAERQAKVFSVETFNGCAQVILKTTDQPGDITLTVAADGCRTATVTMKSRTGQTK